MIDNIYELILGIYLGIIVFFLGYFGLRGYKDKIMENKSLNWIFMTFFIIIFFLTGFLLQNMFVSFREIKKPENIPTLINREEVKDDLKSLDSK